MLKTLKWGTKRANNLHHPAPTSYYLTPESQSNNRSSRHSWRSKQWQPTPLTLRWPISALLDSLQFRRSEDEASLGWSLNQLRLLISTALPSCLALGFSSFVFSTIHKFKTNQLRSFRLHSMIDQCLDRSLVVLAWLHPDSIPPLSLSSAWWSSSVNAKVMKGKNQGRFVDSNRLPPPWLLTNIVLSVTALEEISTSSDICSIGWTVSVQRHWTAACSEARLTFCFHS